MKNPALRKPRLKLLARELQLAQIDDKARRQAVAVLEVLAGLRTAEQAAASLAIAVPTYFALETRAVRALIFACTPNPPGRQQALGKKLRLAEQKIASLQQQNQRYQALLRSAQRAVGLAAPPPAAPAKRKAKKPTVRALRAIDLLQRPAGSSAGEPITDQDHAPGVATPAGAGLGST